MKHTYQSFKEIANDFIDGDNWTHTRSPHDGKQCLVWQKAILEFADWLDECGVKIIENPEIYDTLWKRMRTAKPAEARETSIHPHGADA